jgi:hypothetical protein
MSPALPDSEVKVITSAWKYTKRGENRMQCPGVSAATCLIISVAERSFFDVQPASWDACSKNERSAKALSDASRR